MEDKVQRSAIYKAFLDDSQYQPGLGDAFNALKNKWQQIEIEVNQRQYHMIFHLHTKPKRIDTNELTKSLFTETHSEQRMNFWLPGREVGG